MSRLQRATIGTSVLAVTLCVCTSLSSAQTTLKVGSKEIDIHGSLQQGFVKTDTNNYLTMQSSLGSAAMTDAAINATSNLTRKLRVGAQLYVPNLGELGNGRPQLDWAFADYRFFNALGVRGGKIKTVLGLFNDTQDMEFLYTWALLPQGIYPSDFRVATIAHVGGDAYGTLHLGKAGSLGYTVYGGIIQDDPEGGYRYGIQSLGLTVASVDNTRSAGFDTRWTMPIDGLLTGYSFSANSVKVDVVAMPYNIPISTMTKPWRRHAIYGDYQHSGLRLSTEWRSELRDTYATPAILAPSKALSHSWYAAASYRVFEPLEVGSYYSYYVFDTQRPTSSPDNHIYDTVVTGRVDLNRYWHVKVEGHFMDGYGPAYPLAHGFYLRDNPNGLQATTNMLLIRTGVNF